MRFKAAFSQNSSPNMPSGLGLSHLASPATFAKQPSSIVHLFMKISLLTYEFMPISNDISKASLK